MITVSFHIYHTIYCLQKKKQYIGAQEHTSIIYESFIYKCGGNFKSWKKRWMILSNNILFYYKKNTVKKNFNIKFF